MKNGLKNLFGLLGALAAGFILQLVAAFAVMLPAVIIKEIQIIGLGLQGTPEEAEILAQLTGDLVGPTVFVTHIILLVSFALWYLLGCCKKRGVSEWNAALERTFSGTNLLVIVLVAAGGCYLTNFAMPLASMVIPESIMESYMELMEAAGFGDSILPTIAAVLIAPLGEELIFRGVCYHYAYGLAENMANRRMSFYIVNIIQALAFGIFHGNLVQGTYAFFLGLLLGYLRERFGSILAPILGHLLVNGISSFLWEPIASRLPETTLVFVLGTLFCMAVVILGLKLGGPAVHRACVQTQE